MKYSQSHEEMTNGNHSFGYILSLVLDWLKTREGTHQEKTCEVLEIKNSTWLTLSHCICDSCGHVLLTSQSCFFYDYSSQ